MDIGAFPTPAMIAIMAGVGKAPMSIVDDVIKEAPSTPSGPAVPTGK